MSEPAIIAKDLGVRFKPYLDRRPTLIRSLGRMRHRTPTSVVALDGVSFEVDQGEAFGVVGPNGAGKSTLLRVLAGTMRPDEGTVEVRGRTSTLLQLGVGFNPELSGARNVYLGGLAAGLRKAEIDRLFDDIVSYADLWEAIDRPVKTYSSGMFARLGFSVGMHLNPDILLLDEVLAVGDEAFREKSMQAMQELLERAGTIVFVSHSLNSLADFCDRAMWLEGGRVRALGAAEEVVESYRRSVAQRNS
ncbi:MAG: ABC transporter ATP-binding protein [Acidimicrobiia bacterium]